LRLCQLYVNRDCEAAHERLHRGYFIDKCVYPMIDEYLKLGKTTTLECLEKYCEQIIDSYGIEFLRLFFLMDES
jgi:hypothetical protein